MDAQLGGGLCRPFAFPESLGLAAHLRPSDWPTQWFWYAAVPIAKGISASQAALTRRLGARGSETDALCLAGDVASTGGAEDAEGYYRQALALADELGMRPLVAHCHLGLGKLYQRKGEPEQAREHLATASTMYREMDMQFWREQAKAESAQSR